MGRGVSSGGGQSSLGYLFGSDEPAKPAPPAASAPAPAPVPAAVAPQPTPASAPATDSSPSKGSAPTTNEISPPARASQLSDNVLNPDIAAGKLGNTTNNYHRADGQNTGNFITDRPSTKVHAAPGGGSSLGYLFGGGN